MSPEAGSGVRRLVLVRHGRTAWNLSGRAQGHSDVPLDDVGRAQATAMAPMVARMRPTRLWTSDLVRARETAAHLERATGLVATVDPRLREYDVGLRAGLTMAEFAERFPEEHAAWTAGRVVGQVPGAETTEDVVARMVPALRDLLAATEPGECSVAVAHGACLKVALLALLGWPQETGAALRGMDNCGWSLLEDHADGRGLRLTSYNETVQTPVHEPDFASDSPVG